MKEEIGGAAGSLHLTVAEMSSWIVQRFVDSHILPPVSLYSISPGSYKQIMA
jgi:hypothetical protein